MKLCQGQVWKSGKDYIRIVNLARLAVEYKSMPNLGNKEGTLHQTSKKDFCRLLKGAHLLSPYKKISTPRKEADAANPVQHYGMKIATIIARAPAKRED
jgi:hypothetical protein